MMMADSASSPITLLLLPKPVPVASKRPEITIEEGLDKAGILLVFNAVSKMKPQFSLSNRGFHF
jgi:hypothetical protein